MKTVMIVAGESSGEWYGSLLTKELKDLWPDIRVLGIGGERMKDAGVEILSGISSGLGITELLPSLKRIRDSFSIASKALAEMKPDVLVLIDYPDFNFRLGRVAKRLGIKVLYYVSPQVWVWRKGRVKTMGEIADRVSVILPFEEEIYRKAGIPCEFVGHPAMEELELSDARNLKTEISRGHGALRVALLPGSRPNELKALLPVFINLVRRCKGEFRDPRFTLPLAPNLEIERFRSDLTLLEEEGVRIVKGDVLKCLSSSDAAVIASGTATLQAALLGVPSVVVYKVSLLTYIMGKIILNTKFISLINIMSGEEVLRELIQRKANAEDILTELKRILSDERHRTKMVSSMKRVREAFAGRQPSRRVALTIGEMTGWGLGESEGSSGGH
ncbi:MAG TPA: lipid-A-disaccharide synthase [Thermodesulfovibrionales bacterium]|jgi:lipid-A-disaccharide synthase|nr:lipid-A-disaccharide synthase [Thermodesulfovibrionales bacterium]